MNDATKSLIDAFLPYCKPAERSTWERIRDGRDRCKQPELGQLLTKAVRAVVGFEIRGVRKGGLETEAAKIDALLALAAAAGVSA